MTERGKKKSESVIASYIFFFTSIIESVSTEENGSRFYVRESSDYVSFLLTSSLDRTESAKRERSRLESRLSLSVESPDLPKQAVRRVAMTCRIYWPRSIM